MSEQTNTQVKPWKEQSLIERRFTMEDVVKRNMEVLAKALPRHITVDNLIGTFLTSVAKNPDLLQCTQTSILGSLWTAAKLGLSPDGLLGEGYLIAFNNSKKIGGKWEKVMECQFLPGYRGYVKLAYQSDFIKTFEARCVYENDDFTYEYGLDAKLVHKPTTGVKGKLTHTYMVCHFKNGGNFFTVMTFDEIDTIRLCSKAPESPAWKKFYDEMAKKTVCRNGIKMIPLSTENLTTAASLDEKVEVLNQSQQNEQYLSQDIDVSGDFIDELNEITDAETSPVKEEKPAEKKSNAAMESAVNQVKKTNGKNGNGLSAEMKSAKDGIEFYQSRMNEYSNPDAPGFTEMKNKRDDKINLYNELARKENKPLWIQD